MSRYGYHDPDYPTVVDYEREASRDPGLDWEPDDDRPSPQELAEEERDAKVRYKTAAAYLVALRERAKNEGEG